MKLFVGLGNPGQKFAGNRHNVGFMAVERIADHNDLGPWRKRFHSLACDGQLGDERVLLLKPQTYYNEAGNAVREAAKFLKIKVHDIIVFHDEIDLAPGKLRVKSGGGTAGNNGLRSIQAQLSSPEFTRVRIGVGHPGDKNQVANYVLRNFAKADAEWLETLLDALARSAGRLAAGETERFQTDVAQALNALREVDQKTSAPSSDEPSSNQEPAATRLPPQRTGKGTRPSKRTGGRSTIQGKGQSGAPSQRELARNAATKKHKPSRKIKKGIRDADDVSEAIEDTASRPNETTTASGSNALAARLKRWFSGTTEND